MQKSVKLFYLVLILVGDVFTAPLKNGDVIAVDYGASSGSPQNFNLIDKKGQTIPAGSVVEYGSGKVADGISIQLTMGDQFRTDPACVNWSGTVKDCYYTIEAEDLLFPSTATTFEKLPQSLAYNVRVYALIGDNGDKEDRVVIYGAEKVVRVVTRAARWNAKTLEDAGMVFSNVSPKANGSLTVRTTGFINAVVLEVCNMPTGTLYKFDSEDSAEPLLSDWIIVPDEKDGFEGSNLTRVVWKGWTAFQGVSAMMSIEGTTPGKDNSAIGIIESPVFTVAKDGDGIVSFKHAGGNPGARFIALSASNNRKIAKAPDRQNIKLATSIMTFDLSSYKGKNVYFRLIDNSTKPWGFKLIDDFRINGTVNEIATARRRKVALPKRNIQLSYKGTEFNWKVEDETGVNEYRLVDAKTRKILETVPAVDPDMYSLNVPAGLTLKLVVVYESGESQSYQAK